MNPPAINPGQTFDVVVIGAGPAGSVAAHHLARAGRHVAIIDRATFPRGKVCGCCLNQAAITLLEQEDLADIIPSNAPTLSSLRLAHADSRVTLRTRPGRAISRTTLDDALLSRAIGAGASAFCGLSASLGTRTPEHWSINLQTPRCPTTIFARTILCADGLAGGFLPRETPEWEPLVAPASRMGLGANLIASAFDLPRSRIDMLIARHGYVGLVRLEDDSIDLAAAIDPEFLKQHETPAHAIAAILRTTSTPVPPDLHDARFRGTPLLTRRRPTLELDNIFVAGDAAAYTEPFTGEGMSWAIASGLLAADACDASLRKVYTPNSYTKALRTTLGDRRRFCSIVSSLLRRPTAVRVAFTALRAVPRLAVSASSRVGAPIRSFPRPAALHP